MRNLMKAGLAVLVAGMVMISACSSSDKGNGTGGSTGSGGTTGSGGSTGTDGGNQDAPAAVGGNTGSAGASGTGGAGGAAANPHQDHVNIINKATSGGVPVSRPAPTPYDSCKI